MSTVAPLILSMEPKPSYSLVPGKKRPLPVFSEESDYEDENENLDQFNLEPEPDLLLSNPSPAILRPLLVQSEDWVPGVLKPCEEEISRNRESLCNLFDDSHPASPSPGPVNTSVPLPGQLERVVEEAPRVGPLSARYPLSLRPKSLRLVNTGARVQIRKEEEGKISTTARRWKNRESTEERILREAEEARHALHLRIVQSGRMARKFRLQNEAKGYQTSRFIRN